MLELMFGTATGRAFVSALVCGVLYAVSPVAAVLGAGVGLVWVIAPSLRAAHQASETIGVVKTAMVAESIEKATAAPQLPPPPVDYSDEEIRVCTTCKKAFPDTTVVFCKYCGGEIAYFDIA